MCAGALAAAALAGCATTGGKLEARGSQAERLEDWDRAVVEYSAAVRANPQDKNARLALERAKLRATQIHVASGRRLASAGKLDEALVEYQIASQLSPASTEIDDALRSLQDRAARPRGGGPRTARRSCSRSSSARATCRPPGLDLPADAKLPDSLVFRDASSRDVFTALARFAGVSVVFDPAFRDAPLTIDLRKSTLEQALAAVSASTRNFYRITAPRTLTIVPDTPAKRREYEEEVVRTFYLSNADLKETIDLLRIVIDARRISSVAGTNAIALKDTPGARRGGRQAHRRHRQGPARGGHRRGGARSRPGPTQGIRPADRLPGLARASTARSRINQREPHAARPADADLRRRLPDDVSRRSSTACSRPTTSSRMLANPQLRDD